MPCKTKSKSAGNILNNPHAPPHSLNVMQCGASTPSTTFKLSAATQWFLALMNQNLRVLSQFTWADLMTICSTAVGNQIQPALTLTPSTSIEVDNNNEDTLDFDELSPVEELTNAITAFRQWFEDNNIKDNHPTAAPLCHPAHAPTRTMPHLADIPMEPPAPTCAFSKAASQTPAPIHMVDTPPPPPTIPAAVATLPAAAASIPPASPHGHASYAGAVANNLNPAAPPFVHGPPHAPVPTPAQAQPPVLSKCSKWLFYAI
ncbi:hypothetical protein P691DRAFT_765099 [Macrolepiota fuliginosa MF-IS2]|uniref:Uncharacterized protein n=1 Tax=Macrolepiota fuliginosa MF-IS2 TaxID=1400762 RepID=A0A9P6BYJ0_9AGAR|nr:hypothetical protein P691DRAFT_765099 [Macrolepiota fuliginosa MF-IS2]